MGVIFGYSENGGERAGVLVVVACRAGGDKTAHSGIFAGDEAEAGDCTGIVWQAETADLR